MALKGQQPALVSQARGDAGVGSQPALAAVDPLERLAKLKQVFDTGALDEHEFAAQRHGC
jgi:hypothetical protein